MSQPPSFSDAELSVVFMDTTSLSFEGRGGEACCRERCRDRTNTRHVGTQSNGYSEVIAIINHKLEFVNTAVPWLKQNYEMLGNGREAVVERGVETGRTRDTSAHNLMATE